MQVERRILRAAEAYRIHILRHADHGDADPVDGQGLAERILLGQKVRARVRETTTAGPSPS